MPLYSYVGKVRVNRRKGLEVVFHYHSRSNIISAKLGQRIDLC